MKSQLSFILFNYRSYHGSVNFFGGSQTAISNERLEVIERQNDGAMFVVLSDVYLDKISVSSNFIISFFTVIIATFL
jgi:hypothetical protein